MDNHPMWDGVRFNPEASTQEQSDIGLNALHAPDALCMAELLGRADEAVRFRARGVALGELIEQQLWDDETGLWLSRDWNGTWNYRAAPTCFYPLFLPTTQSVHMERAVRVADPQG